MYQEVIDTIFSFKPYKSLGPNGIHPLFYQKYWDVLGSSIKDFYSNVFTTWTIPMKINETFICLILMISNPQLLISIDPLASVTQRIK